MKKKKSKNYFTQETEKYIIEYNNSTDSEYRAKIFTDHIYYPFYKLAENIIHTFKFYYMDVEDIEDLKYEIISMLLEEKISKFNPEVGAKAYSYFGTIVKRWLIGYTTKNYKKAKKEGSFSEIEESYDPEIDEQVTRPMFTLSSFMDLYIEETYRDLDSMFQKEEELKIADAVLTIFKTRSDLKIFKKKALYIYIREITNCDTPYLTKVINALKDKFYTKYQEYYEKGYIDRNQLY